jgi:hypothetical protein
VAARLRVCVIANNHVSKSSVGSANSRVIGSVAFVNHARAVFMVTPDPEDQDRRLFIPSKTNLGSPQPGLAYRIATEAVPTDDGVIFAPYVKWDSTTITITADEAVAAATVGVEARSAKADAIDFLRDALNQGPVPAKEVQKQAREDGHSEKALRTAREALHVESRREGFGPGSKLTWSLPKHHRCPNPPYMPIFESGHLWGQRASMEDIDLDESSTVVHPQPPDESPSESPTGDGDPFVSLKTEPPDQGIAQGGRS